MGKTVYGIYPTIDDTKSVIMNMLEDGISPNCVLVLTNDRMTDELTDAGVRVENISNDHKSMWERFKHFLGSDDYSNFDEATLVEYEDDVNAGNTLIFVEDSCIPSFANQVIQDEKGKLSVPLPKDASNEDIIRLVEERLSINKQSFQRGEVRLKKRITETNETVTVPVLHEELVIERVTPASTMAGEADFTEEVYSIPLMEERVSVDKVPVVTAEYHISKRAVENKHEISETVRSEELEEVDEYGNAVPVK